MKTWVKLLIGAGAAGLAGLGTLAWMGREENADIVDTDFTEVVEDEPNEDVDEEKEG